jgi:hypothetical protein
MDWIHLAQDRYQSHVNTGTFEFLAWLGNY